MMSKKRSAIANPPESEDQANAQQRSQQAWEQIRTALSGLRYGQVTIIVQDGVVVQINRIERRRLT